MEAPNKSLSHLKELNRKLTTGFNFILVFLVYWIGGGLSFLFLKVSNIRKKKSVDETYWTDYERESDDHHRQY